MNVKKEKYLLFLVFILCLAVRIAYITQKNLWFDEVFSWNLTLDSFYTILVRTSNDIHPPVYYYILKLWNFVFGDSVFSMRLLSALCSSLAVFFMYPISRKVLSPLNSFVVLVLYCISPLNLFYSQEIRMSAMNLLFNATSVYYLIKLIDSKLTVGTAFRNKYVYLFILFTSLALYTHYFSLFILITEILYVIYHYRKDFQSLKSLALVYGAVLLIYSIWIPTFISQVTRGQSWRTSQNIHGVMQEVLNFLKDISLGLYYHFTNLNMIDNITYFLIFLIVVSFAGLIFIKKLHNGDNSLFIISLVFIPLMLAILISFNQRIEYYRYLSILIPYILIFIVYSLNKFKIKAIAAVLVILFASVNIFGMYLHYNFDFKNDDYRGLIKTLDSNYKEGERIYVEPHYNGWIINYTKKHENLRIPNVVDNRYGWDQLMDSLNTQKPAEFWIVMDYSSVDTSKYPIYISDLKALYLQTYFESFKTYPVRVDLYRFKMK